MASSDPKRLSTAKKAALAAEAALRLEQDVKSMAGAMESTARCVGYVSSTVIFRTRVLFWASVAALCGLIPLYAFEVIRWLT